MNCVSLAPSVTASVPSGNIRRTGGRLGRSALQAICGWTLLLLLAFPAALLHAQTFYGSIDGVVKDPSGAVVPGVVITVHETTTATEYKTVTNKSGSYRISFLKPAGYTVRFEK